MRRKHRVGEHFDNPMLVKTTIKEILSNSKREYKYYNGLDFKHEHKGTEYIVTFLCDNGKTYYYNFNDGRKAQTFYAGKEIWGMTRGSISETGNPLRLEYWWWTKKEFEENVKKHILRAEECVKQETETIAYLKSL